MIPRPAAHLRSNWSIDPYTHGSYSYLATGASPDDRVRMREPLGNRVFFAGEHTSSAHPATVHGAGLSGGVAADLIMQLNGQKQDPANEKVIIIGAGAAGLSAARALISKGGYDVTILEARDRIGGRVCTLDGLNEPKGFENMNGGFKLELGANWVHDHKSKKGGRHVHEHLNALKCKTYKYEWNKIRIFDVNSKTDVDPITMKLHGEDLCDLADEWGEEWRADHPDSPDINYTTALENVTNETLHPTIRTPLDMYLRNRFTLEFAASIDEISLFGCEEGTGGLDAIVLGGYNKYINMLADDIKIVKNVNVDNVIWDNGQVQICANDDQIFVADRVICCVPLAIVQKEIIKFTPAMPDVQMKSYQRLKMGLLDKIVLRFSEPWWTSKMIVWETIDSTCTYGPGEEFPFSWSWINFMPLTGEPVLIGMIGGAEGRLLAHMDEEKVLQLALTQLQIFMDNGW